MPGADQGPLGPEMEERLRRELDAVQPRFSSPRYLMSRRRATAWRLAPAALAAAVLGIIGLTAYAGSPNPRVWTEHVLSIGHAQSSPTPAASPKPRPTERESPEPTESPEHHQSPEPRESPEPSGGESESGSSGSGGSTDDRSGSSGGSDGSGSSSESIGSSGSSGSDDGH